MIVRKSSKGLHIIYQAAHGLLAGKIAQVLKFEHRPDLWLDTLVAIIEHDDRQLNYEEKNYLSAIGIPMDFTEDDGKGVDEVLKRAKRVMVQAKSKSLWTAMLVSFHLQFLYGHLKSENKSAKKFLEDQEGFREDVIAHFGINKKEAERVYELLRFCDRCSLILCKDEIPDAERKVEINTSINHQTYFIYRKENGNISVEPWCFEKSRFDISIEETIIQRHKFKNQGEFRNALEDTERSSLMWTFER